MASSGGAGLDLVSANRRLQWLRRNHVRQPKQTAPNARAKQMRSSQGPIPKPGQGPGPKIASRSAAAVPRVNGFNFIYSPVVGGFEFVRHPRKLRAVVSEASIHTLELPHSCWQLSFCCSRSILFLAVPEQKGATPCPPTRQERERRHRIPTAGPDIQPPPCSRTRRCRSQRRSS